MDARIATAARVAEIEPFHVMEVQTAARALEAAGRTVVHMEIGEPDFPTPEPVIAAAQRAIAGGGIFYTSALGLPALREAIARHYADHYGVDIAPERVIVTAGSSAALLLVLALIVDRDDRILLPDPGLSVQSPFRPGARGGAGRHSRGSRHELPADREPGRAELERVDPRRHHRLAVESDGNGRAARRDAADRRRRRGARAAGLSSTRSTLD